MLQIVKDSLLNEFPNVTVAFGFRLFLTFILTRNIRKPKLFGFFPPEISKNQS